MKSGIGLAGAALAVVFAVHAAPQGAHQGARQGPCDIYRAGGTPCVAAHSTTRSLSAAWNGPLYQVKREPDGKTLDIGTLPDSGGYANAAAQDSFCANTICVINRIYDQSGKGNDLYQAPPGPSFPGPSKGGFDTQPIADMAPVTISGHKAYGVFIMPGMGFRNNGAVDIAVGDEPEGIYYVVAGKHYDSGCCFDYGNSSTNGRAVGTGTMETTYFGTSTVWGSGAGPGPWIMSDMEAGLFSGYNARQNAGDPSVDSWRFVTAVVDGGGGNRWDLRGGDAQKGQLTTYYSGIRPGSSTNAGYYPMHKQGGILLGTGGDNGNGSSGTFYEGVMTAGYPTEATTDAVQANIVAARYDVQRVSLSRIKTFSPGETQEVTETFTNTTGAPVTGVQLSVQLPKGWRATGSGAIAGPVAAGASTTATFQVKSAGTTGAGFLTGKATWTNPTTRRTAFDATTARVRNVLPVRINEVRLSNGANPSDQFVELYNSSARSVDLSHWSLVHAQSQWAPVPLAVIPSGTKLESHAFYLLALSGSGLTAPASAGASVIHVRSSSGFEVGQKIDVEGEARTIAAMGSAASPMTTVFEPVSTGPWLTIPSGSTKLPVTNAAGFEAGQQIGIDAGGNFEVAIVTAAGKAATQTTLTADSVAGAKNIQVAASTNMTLGDALTVGAGRQKETTKIQGVTGTTVELAVPLRLAHMHGVDVSDEGTGIRFTPATRFAHMSGDSVQALGSGITLDRPLTKAHAYGAPVVDPLAGAPSPNQWFGGALSIRAGSIALLDATGAIADAMVYGSQQSNSSANGTIVSPELATLEGDQGQGGCIVVVPVAAGSANRSVGRFPDGADTDSNCDDFRLQPATTLPAGSMAGATNIKVAGVADFAPGQTVSIDTGRNLETAVIATVGTAGAAALSAGIAAGATVIPVNAVAGFSAGQTITVDSGANSETAVIASIAGGRGGARITVAAALTLAHAAGAQVSGSGITLKQALTRAHANGAQIATDLPTPGAPNQYAARIRH